MSCRQTNLRRCSNIRICTSVGPRSILSHHMQLCIYCKQTVWGYIIFYSVYFLVCLLLFILSYWRINVRINACLTIGHDAPYCAHMQWATEHTLDKVLELTCNVAAPGDSGTELSFLLSMPWSARWAHVAWDVAVTSEPAEWPCNNCLAAWWRKML